MGKVSMAVRSAAMSYIEPWLPTILGRGKMRTKILKVVVVLLLSGSGDGRPQRTEEFVQRDGTKASLDEWRPRSGVSRTIQEDSRYTWNSGSSRFPYTNYYHPTINPLINLNGEVSVNEPRKSSNFRNSQRSIRSKDSSVRILKNSDKFRQILTNKPADIPNKRISIISNEQTVENHNRNRSFYKIPGFTSNRDVSVNQRRIPLKNSRVNEPSTMTNSSKDFRNSNDKMSTRSSELVVNKPGPIVSSLVHNSRTELSDQKHEFSSDFDRNIKVESTTQFDHVAAIKKITSILAQENPPNNGNHLIKTLENTSNRHSNLKNSNRTKPRRPPNKKAQNKIISNKIIRNKNNSSAPNFHLKNWPNGAIQNAEDFHNYDTYTSLDDDLKPEETMEKPIPNPHIQEIVHWLKIPAFMSNGSHIVESSQVNDPITVAFDPVYQNLEPNKPSKPSNVQTFKPGFVYPVYIRPSYTTDRTMLKNKTIYNPQTQTLQNTVVHLINTDSKRPNRTKISGVSKKPSSSSSSNFYSSSTTSKPGPNVHIGFTSYEDNNKVSEQQKPQTPMVTYDHRCPTILINSYTRINNTIQSKEGCTDLNIIINSQVFNTNTYKTTASPLSESSNNNYPSDSNYIPVPVYQPASQNDYYNPPKVPQDEIPQMEVVQDTQISISNPVISDSSLPVEASVVENEESVGSSVTGSSGVVQGDSSSGNSLVKPATAANVPGSSSSDSSSSPPAGLAGGSSPSTSLYSDDDEDDYDLTPSGIMESLTSVFTYFTFVNPLHYGFFSIAAAPFTAVAAGVLGIATFLYPWLFPSTFGFRANNEVADSLWTNLEEVVKQSMHKYGGLNEWKSKRKKRKR